MRIGNRHIRTPHRYNITVPNLDRRKCFCNGIGSIHSSSILLLHTAYETHKKLSKRCGHSSYEDLIEQGFLTEAIVNYIALLGWSPEDDKEIFSLEELIAAFDYRHMGKAPSVFDYTKLKWMNGEYFKSMDDDKFFEMAEKHIKVANAILITLLKISITHCQLIKIAKHR